MKRDHWKSPLPGNAVELVQALAEKTLRPGDAVADIHPPSADAEGTDFDGWTADVFRRGCQPWDPDEKTFETVAFESKASLVAALNVAGIKELRFSE
jgi:hypothetical protein